MDLLVAMLKLGQTKTGGTVSVTVTENVHEEFHPAVSRVEQVTRVVEFRRNVAPDAGMHDVAAIAILSEVTGVYVRMADGTPVVGDTVTLDGHVISVGKSEIM